MGSQDEPGRINIVLAQRDRVSGKWVLDPRMDPQDRRMETTKCEVCLGNIDLLYFYLSTGFVEEKVGGRCGQP